MPARHVQQGDGLDRIEILNLRPFTSVILVVLPPKVAHGRATLALSYSRATHWPIASPRRKIGARLALSRQARR